MTDADAANAPPTDAAGPIDPAALAARIRATGRSVVMIGLMGAGKSSIGRRLAQALAFEFRDADTEIEEAAGMSIPDIFALHGEDAFRDGERRVIRRLLNEPPHVLATGGGAYINPKTRALIHRRGVSVWLKAELDVLVRRTARRDNRPLLRAGDPRAILAKLMTDRYPIYAEADLAVDTGDGPHEQAVAAVVAALNAAFPAHAPPPPPPPPPLGA